MVADTAEAWVTQPLRVTYVAAAAYYHLGIWTGHTGGCLAGPSDSVVGFWVDGLAYHATNDPTAPTTHVTAPSNQQAGVYATYSTFTPKAFLL